MRPAIPHVISTQRVCALVLAALLLAGCPGTSTSSDASLDRADVPDVTVALDALDVTTRSMQTPCSTRTLHAT